MLFKKNPKEKEHFKATHEKRNYDEFFKHKLDKKKLFTTLGVVFMFALLVVIIMIAKVFFEKVNLDPVDTTPPPVLSDAEQYNANLQLALSNGYLIGLTTRDELIASGTIDTNNSGNSFLIKDGYTSINGKDYLSTYLLKDDILVGIVHEAILDTGTKDELATEFQTLTSDLNRAYSNMEISKRWFSDPVVYDANTWNYMISNNELELVAELAEDTEFVKVIVSGVPYFDYLYDNYYDQGFGNLTIIYSDGSNQKLFSNIDSLGFKD